MGLRKTIFDKKTFVKLNKVTGTYPHKDNCFEAKIYPNGPDSNAYIDSFLPKAQFKLAEQMKNTLTKKQIDALIPLLEDMWDEAYQTAVDVCEIDAAESDS